MSRGKIASNNRDTKLAHKRHRKNVIPYLRTAIRLLGMKPGKPEKKILEAIKLLDQKWRRFCIEFESKRDTQLPNTEAFKDSLKLYTDKFNQIVEYPSNQSRT